MIAWGCPLSRGYLRSSTKNGCPTNSVLSTRRGVSAPTYIVNGTREPVTSIRNPWNVPAGTLTASGAPTLNVSTLMAFSLGVKQVRAKVLPATSGSAGTTNGTAFSSTVPGGDRKSTRLNSSHSQISYAVFCLKKKNTKHITALQ